MSFQVVVIGLPGSGRTSFLKAIKNGRANEEDQLQEPIILQTQNAIFTFTENWQQALESATCGVFCIDGTNLDQLSQMKELFNEFMDKMPSSLTHLIIVQTKADLQAIDPSELKDFLNISDIQKEVLVTAVSSMTGDGIQEITEWINLAVSKNDRKVSFEFEAEPRVVKSRGKYKINDQQVQSKSQQTFTNLMKDKRIKLLDPVQQEQEYIRLEKERIKIENMHKQLDKFKQNKKKMTPYDVKPLDGKKQQDKNSVKEQEDEKDVEKPSIEVNLEFFLTDFTDTIEKTTSTVDTQTDHFNEQLDPPPSPPYIPKKTGIDHATQVEDYELFDFDREVTPTLDVICTKTLEEACLEIEQEEELLAMKRFKEAFYRKRAGEKDKQRNVVLMEQNEIERKNRLLKKYLEREERKIYLLRKAQAYNIAGTYLSKLQPNVVVSVFKNGYYPNEFQNNLQTKFVDWLVEKTLNEAKRLCEIREKMNGTFDKDNLVPIKLARAGPDAIIQKKKILSERRRINQGDDIRMIRVLYQDEAPQPTAIAQKLPKLMDGSLEEYEKNLEVRLSELEQKLDLEQMNEEEFINTKKTEFPEIPQGYLGLSVQKMKRLAFSFAHNQYYSTTPFERKFEPFALVIEKSGKWNLIDNTNLRDGKIISYKSNIRQSSLKVADDIGIMVRLDYLDNDVIGILFGFRLPNLQANTQPQIITDLLQYSRFGVYDGEFMIPYDQTNVISAFKLEELLKQQDNPELAELPQTSIHICYSVVKRFKHYGRWFLEGIKTAQKGLIEDEISKFYQKLSLFFVEQYEYSLLKDKDYIERLLEKEAEGTPITVEDRQNLGYKRKVRLAQTKTNESKDQSIIEQAIRSIDEPQVLYFLIIKIPKEIPKTLHFSRITQNVKLSIKSQFEQNESKLIKHLQETEAVLIESCLHGFEILVSAKPFVRSRQLIRAKNIGDITIIRKPEPPPQKVEEQPAEGQENQENQEIAEND